MLLLSVEGDSGTTLTYRLNKTQVTVGASSRNDIVVRSAGVADRHLVIHRNDDVFTFVTVNRQTVVLNGERRSRGVLNPGDKLRVGTMTLVFRGGEAGALEVVEKLEPSPAAGARAVEPAVRVSDGAVVHRDVSGFAEIRSRMLELFYRPRRDRLHQVVSALHEALPEAEVAILAPGEGEEPVALASVWRGELPRISRKALEALREPGHFAVLEGDEGITGIVPVLTPDRQVSALMALRPYGSLGEEGMILLGEVARHLALHWSEVEREDSSFTGWELEARHRLEMLQPGSSQAVQVLRASVLAAAHGSEPTLICGAEGVGRTEVARILATLGPVGGRPVVVFEGRDAESDTLRQELFGRAKQVTLGAGAEGLVGRARGGILLVRNVDRVPVSLQGELAALFSSQQREPLSSASIRGIVTCGEDPLALVQKGRLAAPLFMVFAQRMLRVPRLSERREDLPLLIAGLLRRTAEEQQKSLRGVTLDCLNALLARPFPGEMAELVGEMNRLVTATPDGEMVRCEPLSSATPGGVIAAMDAPTALMEVLSGDNLKEIVPKVEQYTIDKVMRRVKGNQSKAARILGISRGALIAKLKEYSIPDYRYLRRRRERAS